MDNGGTGRVQTTNLREVTPEEMTAMTEANQVREVVRLRFKLLAGWGAVR